MAPLTTRVTATTAVAVVEAAVREWPPEAVLAPLAAANHAPPHDGAASHFAAGAPAAPVVAAAAPVAPPPPRVRRAADVETPRSCARCGASRRNVNVPRRAPARGESSRMTWRIRFVALHNSHGNVPRDDDDQKLPI